MILCTMCLKQRETGIACFKGYTCEYCGRKNVICYEGVLKDDEEKLEDSLNEVLKYAGYVYHGPIENLEEYNQSISESKVFYAFREGMLRLLPSLIKVKKGLKKGK